MQLYKKKHKSLNTNFVVPFLRTDKYYRFKQLKELPYLHNPLPAVSPIIEKNIIIGLEPMVMASEKDFLQTKSIKSQPKHYLLR